MFQILSNQSNIHFSTQCQTLYWAVLHVCQEFSEECQPIQSNIQFSWQCQTCRRWISPTGYGNTESQSKDECSTGGGWWYTLRRWCHVYCSRSFLPGPLLFFDWMPVPGSVQLIWAHVISSFIQTIIQPFPNARRQLPSCIPSWLEANIGRVFDPKESSGVQATWHGAMARARTHGQQKYVLLRCKTITIVPCGPMETISNEYTKTDGFSTS